MAILITGAAGFIGSQVAKSLLKRGERIIGIDNLNDYYDVRLKENRIKDLEALNLDYLYQSRFCRQYSLKRGAQAP
jgi:UDP-glucuronate 4-epimerase